MEVEKPRKIVSLHKRTKSFSLVGQKVGGGLKIKKRNNICESAHVLNIFWNFTEFFHLAKS